MDKRRFLNFLLFYALFAIIFQMYIAPMIFPEPKPVLKDPVAAEGDDQTEDADIAEATSADEDSPLVVPDHPDRQVQLGSLDPESGYFLQANLTTRGAAIESVTLTDPKFADLENQEAQVSVLSETESSELTFGVGIDAIDTELKAADTSLETAHWEIKEEAPGKVVFAYTLPDQNWRITKTYELAKSASSPDERKDAYRTENQGYLIQMALAIENLADQTRELEYELQGPVGVILENESHTRKYRDIKMEFLGDEKNLTFTPKEVAGLYDEYDGSKTAIRKKIREEESWTGVFRYAGIDVQFFAALVAPNDSRDDAARIANRRIARTYPTLISKPEDNVYYSDISFRMVSEPLEIDAGKKLTHKYDLFVGPKRRELLDPEPLNAQQVLDYGSWFGFVARGMHWLLSSLYTFGMPYFLAIICLTVFVRGCLFPLTRKQAISAARMRELQPKLTELKAKYGDDKEGFAKAQMQLWSKHKINPLGGCLPVFFQLPIFIGLYTCLNTAVDLRLSKFLWIDNLAAPDALFGMPKLPFFGSEFNILPCITVSLFLMQQKLFMPPPTDEQTAATQKMMNFMTLFMGAFFWHAPAGLCLYFIASSAWGIAERKLLGTGNVELPEVKVIDPKDDDAEPQQKGFFARMQDKVEEMQKQVEAGQQQNEKGKNKRNGNGKGKNKKKRK